MKRRPLLVVPLVVLGLLAGTGGAGIARHAQARRTFVVEMIQQGSRFVFRPSGVRIRAGDMVEFRAVSGLPHNVQFYAGRIPDGAREVLNRAMAQRIGDLASPMLTRAGQTYSISFAGAPEGTYDFFCRPHEELGMKGTIVVGRPGGPGSTINDGEPAPARVPPRD